MMPINEILEMEVTFGHLWLILITVTVVRILQISIADLYRGYKQGRKNRREYHAQRIKDGL